MQARCNSMASQRVQCPRPIENSTGRQSALPMSTTPDDPPLSHPKSKPSLLGLFARNRSIKMASSNHKMDISLESEDTPDQKSVNQKKSGVSQTRPTPSAQVFHISSHSSDLTPTTHEQETSRATLKIMLEKKDSSTSNLAPWSPPELFKAYPQAIKHARLRAPTTHGKPLLQLHKEKKVVSFQLDLAQDAVLARPKKDNVKLKREKDGRVQQPLVEMTSNVHWAEKIYVLATSGYILEYAGEGAFDRLPEKLMPLGKDSVAFASDAIPGAHWVLQVSRVADEGAVASTDGPKSVFKKMRFGNVSRLSTSNLLLVFNSPEDMNSWLVSIRKAIEALGGKQYQSDGSLRGPSYEAARALQERPSRQCLVKRDPNRFATSAPILKTTDEIEKRSREKLGTSRSSSITDKNPPVGPLQPPDFPPLAKSTTSPNQANMERFAKLPRTLHISAGTKTWSTSRGSSAEPSPARSAFSLEDLVPKRVEDGILDFERSITQQQYLEQTSTSYPSRTDKTGPQPNTGSHRDIISHSHIDIRSSSPPALTFSKRYSCITNPTLMSPVSPVFAVSAARPPFAISQKANSPELAESKEVFLKPRRPIDPIAHSTILTYSKIHDVSGFPSAIIKGDSPFSFWSQPNHSGIRRFSFDYTNEAATPRTKPTQSPSPHPPPAIALPALPKQQPSSSPQEFYRQDQRTRNTVDVQVHKKRRPVSMQAYNDSPPRSKYYPLKVGWQNLSETDEYSLSAPRPTTPKANRARPPSPLSLSKCRSEAQDPAKLTHIHYLLLDDLSPETPPQLDPPSFLDLENSPIGALEGPWSTSYTGEGHGFQDVEVQ